MKSLASKGKIYEGLLKDSDNLIALTSTFHSDSKRFFLLASTLVQNRALLANSSSKISYYITLKISKSNV